MFLQNKFLPLKDVCDDDISLFHCMCMRLFQPDPAFNAASLANELENIEVCVCVCALHIKSAPHIYYLHI